MASTTQTPSAPQLFGPPPKPASSLARYRLLSAKSGIKVSPLCLGGMSLGSAWKDSPFVSGELNEKDSFALLDHFYKLGGNFIDTANNYQDGESESIIGRWMKSRNNRESIVLATKFSSPDRPAHGSHGGDVLVNHSGNSIKSLRTAVDNSLKRLQTDYIDILYLHWWDHSNDIGLVMRALNQLVASGKVLQLGISDTPAWVVSKANEYARHHGFAEFVVYQGKYNLGSRDMEREIIPMCRDEGLAIAPWAVIAQGRYRTQEQVEQRLKDRGAPIRGGAQNETEKKIGEALSKLSKKHGGASGAQLCIAYVLHKYPYAFPIIGGTKLHYIDDNVKALDLKLTPEDVHELETLTEFTFGFPHDMIGLDSRTTGDVFALNRSTGVVDFALHPNTVTATYEGPWQS